MRHDEEYEKVMLGIKVLILARNVMSITDPDWPKVTQAIRDAEDQLNDIFEAIAEDCALAVTNATV